MLTPQILLDLIEALRDNPDRVEIIIQLINLWKRLTPTPTLPSNNPSFTPTRSLTETQPPGQTPTPSPTRISGLDIFQDGDGLIDFSVFPDGSPIDGVEDPSTFTPGTYLLDQFADVGVRFRSTIEPISSNPLSGIGTGVVGGPNNSFVTGMRHAPIPPSNTFGSDARTVWEVQFDEPVMRAGILRRGLVNYVLGHAITNFYADGGGLITSIITTEDGAFVSHEVAEGAVGIKRVEITSNGPGRPNDFGAGGGDNLFFSQVGALEIPLPLRYTPSP